MVNLDWNPKNLEGKCSKETFKLNDETEIKNFLTKVFEYWMKNMYLKKVTSRKIQKWQFIGFYWRSSDFLTHIIAHKQAEKTHKNAIDQAHMQLRLRARALRHLFGSLFKSTDLNIWKKNKSLDRKKTRKAHIDICIIIFPIHKCNGI